MRLRFPFAWGEATSPSTTVTASTGFVRSGAAVLRHLEVWTDTEAAGGSRLSVFTDVFSVEDDLRLGDAGKLGRERMRAQVNMRDSAFDDVREGRVLRVELSDGEANEWRIVEILRERSDNGERATIKGESIARDLYRRTPLIQRVESNRADLDFNLLRLSPTEWIDDVILVTDDFPSWITRGTVGSSADVSSRVDGDFAGTLMDRVAESVGFEWSLRRSGSTGYKIDLEEQRGGSTRRPFIGLKRNLLSAKHRTNAKEQATRVYPRGGGPDGFRATMAEAKWKVTSISSNTVTLADPGGGDGPIAFADQLGGSTGPSPNLWLEAPDGTTVQITDSTTNQTADLTSATALSTGNLVSIRSSSSGDDLIHLEHPASRDTYGLQVKPLERRNLPNVENLVTDVGSAFLSEWGQGSTALPDGWQLVGSSSAVTVTKETGAGFWRHGGASAKVVCSSGGVGIECSEIAISPSSGDEAFVAQAVARADAGSYQVQMVEVGTTGNETMYPEENVKAARNTRLFVLDRHDIAPGVNFDDRGSTGMKGRVVSHGGSATFYVDALQILQREKPASAMWDARAANVLWQETNDELGRVNTPEDNYDVATIDLHRTDIDTYPDDKLTLGQKVIVKDPGLSVDTELRIVGIKRELTRPGDVTLQLDQQRKTLADRLAERRKNMPELIDERPPESGSQRTEGSDLSALSSKLGTIQGEAQDGRWIQVGIVTDNTGSIVNDVNTGELWVVPFAPAKTFVAQGLEGDHQNGGTSATQRGTLRLVVYSDSNGYPDTLLFESGDFNVDSDSDNAATDVEVSGTIIEFEVGKRYWVGWQMTATPDDPDLPDMGFWNSGLANMLGASGAASASQGVALKSTGNGGSVPDVYPETATVETSGPRMGLLV